MAGTFSTSSARNAFFNIEVAGRATAAVGASALRRARRREPSVIDLFLCIVDHFEPRVGGASAVAARTRLEDWLLRYPRLAARHRDAEGRAPAHSFFYPWDECDPWELDRLAELCSHGWGEIELHLHHRDDTEASLRPQLREALRTYRAAGALSTWPTGSPAFGFIHGNWSLDNSRREGGRNYCGVDNELDVLVEEGCYADFTFPSWQKLSQPRQVNSVYYARDVPDRPKSYDRGKAVAAGKTGSDGLLMVQGPLVPYLQRMPGADGSGSMTATWPTLPAAGTSRPGLTGSSAPDCTCEGVRTESSSSCTATGRRTGTAPHCWTGTWTRSSAMRRSGTTMAGPTAFTT